jgi:hypothetical protein
VVRAEDSHPRGRGFESWMDVRDLLAITLREKLKIKVAKWGTPKKNIYTVKLGYNELGYNKLPVITKSFFNFFSPKST